MPIPVPANPHEIDPDWMTAVLRSIGRLGLESVTHVSVEVIGADRGFTGVVARVSLTYSFDNLRNAPATVVVKMLHAPRSEPSAYLHQLSTNPQAMRTIYQRGIREIAFFDEIMPESHTIAPQLLFSSVDAHTLESILVLEDVRDAIPGDALAGCSIGDAELVLRSIASLHGRWWSDPSLTARPWLQPIPSDPETRRSRYAAALPTCLTRFGAHMPDHFHELLVNLERNIPALIARLENAPRTIVHADLHLDNVLFTPGLPEHPVRILDWQTVTIGPAAQDLALFISGSLAPEHQWSTDKLLDLYHAEILRHGVEAYDRAELQRDYQLSLLRAIVLSVIWLGTVEMNTLGGRELALVESIFGDGRYIAAAESQRLLSAILAV